MAEIKAPVAAKKNPLYTIKDKNINQISGKLIDFIDKHKLLPGQKLKFRILQSKPNPDSRPGKPRKIFPNITLRTQFWINDTNGPVEIAAIQSVDGNNNFRVKKFHVDTSDTDGIFWLYGNNVEHQKVFPILMLSPENAASPFKNDVPLFEMVDITADAKKLNSRITIQSKCFKAIELMDLEELTEFNLAFGGDLNDDEDVMRANLNGMAVADPIEFFKKVDQQETKLNALISHAEQINAIQYDAHQHLYRFVGTEGVDGQMIAKLDRIEGKQPKDQLVDWLIHSKHGETMQQMIRSAIKK